jgi:hypothetical protein
VGDHEVGDLGQRGGEADAYIGEDVEAAEAGGDLRRGGAVDRGGRPRVGPVDDVSGPGYGLDVPGSGATVRTEEQLGHAVLFFVTVQGPIA